jgi:hypothetical protein
VRLSASPIANHVPPLVCRSIALLLVDRVLNHEATEVFYGGSGFELVNADMLECIRRLEVMDKYLRRLAFINISRGVLHRFN